VGEKRLSSNGLLLANLRLSDQTVAVQISNADVGLWRANDGFPPKWTETCDWRTGARARGERCGRAPSRSERDLCTASHNAWRGYVACGDHVIASGCPFQKPLQSLAELLFSRLLCNPQNSAILCFALCDAVARLWNTRRSNGISDIRSDPAWGCRISPKFPVGGG
jgi:hypothetical protein